MRTWAKPPASRMAWLGTAGRQIACRWGGGPEESPPPGSWTERSQRLRAAADARADRKARPKQTDRASAFAILAVSQVPQNSRVPHDLGCCEVPPPIPHGGRNLLHTNHLAWSGAILRSEEARLQAPARTPSQALALPRPSDKGELFRSGPKLVGGALRTWGSPQEGEGLAPLLAAWTGNLIFGSERG